MRLHVLSRDPLQLAAMHMDSDVLQRCLGFGQVLAAVHRAYGSLSYSSSRNSWVTSGGSPVYSPLPLTDLLVQWACATPGNYSWLSRVYRAFLEEHQYRWKHGEPRAHHAWNVFEALRDAPSALRAQRLDQPDSMTPFLTARFYRGSDNTVRQEPVVLSDDADPVVHHRRLYADSVARAMRRKKSNLHKLYTRRQVPAFLFALEPTPSCLETPL